MPLDKTALDMPDHLIAGTLLYLTASLQNRTTSHKVVHGGDLKKMLKSSSSCHYESIDDGRKYDCTCFI